MNNFEAEAKGAVLDLTGDSNTTMVAKKNAMKWDVKKKKYIRADQVRMYNPDLCASQSMHFVKLFFPFFQNEKKKIKTESGVWIPASYKSNRYSKWKERSKLNQLEEHDSNDEGDSGGNKGLNDREGRKRKLSLIRPFFFIKVYVITTQINCVQC